MKKSILFTLIFLFFAVCNNECFAEKSNSDLQKATIQQIEKVVNKKVPIKDPKLLQTRSFPNISKEEYHKKELLDNKKYISNSNKSLKEEQQKLYVLLDKLIRANNLQYQNWRTGVYKETEEYNAYATTANLIVVYSGLYDSLYNNDDALAYILSHELAHFLLNHHQERADDIVRYERIGYKSVNYTILIKSIDYLHSWRIQNKNRKREIAADKEALTIFLRGGFNPEKVLEGYEVMARLPYYNTLLASHPKPKKRIKQIQKEFALLDAQKLKEEGQYNLYKSEVSKVKRSSDKKSIFLYQEDGSADTKYSSVSKKDKYIDTGYIAYKKGNMKKANKFLKKAYRLDSKNYSIPLYLAYINENLYKTQTSSNLKYLKQSKKWIKKAKKLNPTSKEVLQQEKDINLEFEKITSQKDK